MDHREHLPVGAELNGKLRIKGACHDHQEKNGCGDRDRC